MIRTALVISSILLLAACNPQPNDPETNNVHDPLVLEVYPANSGMADRIESSLSYLLSGSENRLGRVTTLPNGHIAVSAPASMQSGIGALIKQIAESGPTETRQVRIRQWLIEGIAAEETSVPKNLASLEAELRDFAAAAGDMEFEQLDTAEHIMLDGTRSNVRSKLLNSSLRTRIENSGILIDVNNNASDMARLSTELNIESRQALVMAQVEKPRGDQEEVAKVIMFVIRAEIL